MTDSKLNDPKKPKASGKDPKPAAEADPDKKPSASGSPESNAVSITEARTAGEKAGRESAKAEYQARVDAIRQACELGGCPERFGEFLQSDLSPEAVGKKLLEERAAGSGPDLNAQHSGNGDGEDEPVIDTRAIYKRWNDASAFAAGKNAS